MNFVMSSQCFVMNLNRIPQNGSDSKDMRLALPTGKVMSYEEKTVGSTQFFKCEACPYMALAEDDIKFHLFTEHPELARSNGLADNIQISCPGCTSVFDAEESLRNHLRNHHKMGIKDVRKMVKSLVQIALKNAKLKKETKTNDTPPPPLVQDVPELIEIVPDIITAKSESLPVGVSFISLDELNKMRSPNFEQVDPKEIIQEASINIVYSDNATPDYLKVSDASTSNYNNHNHNIKLANVPPDLISSIRPKLAPAADKSPPTPKSINSPNTLSQSNIRIIPESQTLTDENNLTKTDVGTPCLVNRCQTRFTDVNNLTYHRKCHNNDVFRCPECCKIFQNASSLHNHLWKGHAIDLELFSCHLCGFKTSKRHRLLNFHMRCHKRKPAKPVVCPICSKSFKDASRLEKHKLVHKKENVECTICHKVFMSGCRLKTHMSEVHEKIKPFKCTQCSYTAARKEVLKLHMRSHTGDKPYSCNDCSFRCSDHSALQRHKKQHTKEGVYKCKHCPYTAIQSTVFTSHIISKHPNVNTDDVHCCPFCRFKTVSKDKYVTHLTTHPDKEGVKLLLEMMKSRKSKPNWTVKVETTEKTENLDTKVVKEIETEPCLGPADDLPIEVYDCDSLSETMSESVPQDYSNSFCASSANDAQEAEYNSQTTVTDLSKDDNNSDCLISESSNDTLMDRQYSTQHSMQMNYDNIQTNIPLHGFLSTSAVAQSLQSSSVSSLASQHTMISNNIMSNFPIRLPLAPQNTVCNNLTLKSVDKISLSMNKVTGPIITPTQILPVPSSSNSPVNVSNEQDGAPRKKPKISVKSNLILKGPDRVNMFHSQQKLAFKQLEDNERFCLGSPVTFNNLITTQFMQLPPEPTLSESPNNIMPYPQESMMGDTVTTPVGNVINENPQIFAFNPLAMLPPPQKIQQTDPSYIKIEAIKQNTQSPSLERMCNANLLNGQSISREYKASPPLEDMNKNMSEIKNELKSDYFNMALTNSSANPTIMDQYLMDNIVGEQYSGHLDLSAVLPEVSDDQQNDVIEIDDNSDDTKLLPRFDMNYPLESLYLMHNDFHFLDNEIPANNEVHVSEMSRMVTEVPIINQKDISVPAPDTTDNDFPNFIEGKKDPMMNTSVRPSTNKINVKNIELMKN